MPGPVPVYSLADEQRGRAEAAAWAHFTAAADPAALYASWLALLAARLERARGGVLLTREGQADSFAVAAVWPDPRRDMQYLGPVAERVLQQAEGLALAPDGQGPPPPDGSAHVGYPLEMDGQVQGAVVFDIGPGDRGALQAALRQIHWASAWLIDHFRQAALALRDQQLARSALLNEVLATAMQHARTAPSALAVANELASRLRCDRVSIGLEQGGEVRPLAMSNTASFDPRSDLVRWLGEAMDEAFDLGAAVLHPAATEDELGALAHGESARRLGVAAMLSVPIRQATQTIGVISFERNQGPPFDAGERDSAAALGLMLGPVWALQRDAERSALARLRTSLGEFARELLGPRHPGAKLAGVLLLALVAGLALWQVDHRVSARTVVEGATQLAAVAPFDGFIAQGLVRAGETVTQGQPLARLDDRDLRLERARHAAEREQLQRRYQVAQAQADRANMGVLAAQLNQAEAQLSLADERLARTTVVAPYDGVVVSGDLSQQIGSPVETGRVLFEVAPLAGYRVMLEVDDRDIARLAARQPGELVLAGLPGQVLPIAVRRITPVAKQRDGRNLFVVEAAVQGPAPAGLRPGMEGVGKVTVGRHSLLWVWTHGFVDWLRVAAWSWLP